MDTTTVPSIPRPLPLRGYLANRCLTTRVLATRIGVHPVHLSRVIHQHRPITRDLALAIAAELSLDLDQATLLLGPPASWAPGRRGRRDPDAGALVAV